VQEVLCGAVRRDEGTMGRRDNGTQGLESSNCAMMGTWAKRAGALGWMSHRRDSRCIEVLAMRVQRFEDLFAWQQARGLVRGVYSIVRCGPARRDFGYRDQICNASISVMTNIAEGFSRRSRVEFARFLDISRSSAREVQSLLYAGLDLGYLSNVQFEQSYALAGVTAQTIGRLMASLPT
jgi:four helix bundle protein